MNKATREFNEMLAQNAKLREDIQHLRNQRGIFDTIHKRLCKNLVGKKREQVRLESNQSGTGIARRATTDLTVNPSSKPFLA